MQISKERVETAYQRYASNYDLAVKLFYPLIGLSIGVWFYVFAIPGSNSRLYSIL
jgi:hypothetical protein